MYFLYFYGMTLLMDFWTWPICKHLESQAKPVKYRKWVKVAICCLSGWRSAGGKIAARPPLTWVTTISCPCQPCPGSLTFQNNEPANLTLPTSTLFCYCSVTVRNINNSMLYAAHVVDFTKNRKREKSFFAYACIILQRPSGYYFDHWCGGYCVVNKRHLGNTETS